MHELSLRICGAVQTHLQNFLWEDRCDSFADSGPYCRWRRAMALPIHEFICLGRCNVARAPGNQFSRSFCVFCRVCGGLVVQRK
jgi:hypothetical protein